MKEVSILISNRDSFEAIQLTVESIRKHTRYPHKIVVFDDRSRNDIDVPYLQTAQEKGWLGLHRNTTDFPLTHGGSLNMLINEICDTEYAIVLDCDVMITDSGWLEGFMDAALSDEKILAVVDTKPKGYTWKGFIPPVYHFWFGLLNMKAYNDGMKVNWINTVEDASKQPYKSLFNDLVDVENNPVFMSLVKQGKRDLNIWNKDVVSNDCGSQLWMKVTYDNPKGYYVVALPKELHRKHYHFRHSAIVGVTAHSSEEGLFADQARHKFKRIKGHLEELRCQN